MLAVATCGRTASAPEALRNLVLAMRKVLRRRWTATEVHFLKGLLDFKDCFY
jgi:hypothetical protein